MSFPSRGLLVIYVSLIPITYFQIQKQKYYRYWNSSLIFLMWPLRTPKTQQRQFSSSLISNVYLLFTREHCTSSESFCSFLLHVHVKKWTDDFFSFLLLVKKLLTETFDSIQTVHSNVRFPNITTALLFHSNKILQINQNIYFHSLFLFLFMLQTREK